MLPNFLAISAAGCGAALRRRLRLSGVPPAQQVPAVDYHVTLHYLGRQPVARMEALAAALAEVCGDRFPLILSGAGSFRGEGSSQVLWVGVEPAAELLALHARVAVAITAAGLPLESRPYHPHLTVARVNDASPEIAASFVRANRDLRLMFEVGSFELCVTNPYGSGPRYSPLASWSLPSERPRR